MHKNDMHQAVDCELFLYTDDSCLVYQHHRDAKAIEAKLNINFSTVCNWFVDNRLSTHFGGRQNQAHIVWHKAIKKRYQSQY